MPPADSLCGLEDRIPCDEAHAWWTALDLPKAAIAQMAELLSEQEKNRASRLIHSRHRERFTVAHGVLRLILAGYLKIPPEKVCFEYTRQGKPSLAGLSGSCSLCFNLSHSQGRGLYGVCLNRSIGVDIERIRPMAGMASIVRRYFSVAEASRILTKPPSERGKIFFQYWSMKEACLKARGDGLGGLHRIDLATDLFSAIPEVICLDEQQKPWLIQPLTIDEKHAAAVAVEGDASLRVVCRQWRA